VELSIRIIDRIVLQMGENLGELPGCVVEESTPEIDTQIQTLLAQVQGDGGVSISADHTTISIVPPSAAWTQLATAASAAAAIRQQHSAALDAIKAALTANSTLTANDITAIKTLITNLQAGTAPTQAQLLQLLRFQLRSLAVLNG